MRYRAFREKSRQKKEIQNDNRLGIIWIFITCSEMHFFGDLKAVNCKILEEIEYICTFAQIFNTPLKRNERTDGRSAYNKIVFLFLRGHQIFF